MKKFLSFCLVLLFSVHLCACGNSASKSKESGLIISDYYKEAADYEKIEPLIKQYLSIVHEALNNSDKKNPKTFVLPEKYKTVDKELESLNNYSNLSDVTENEENKKAYLLKSELLSPYLKIETKIAGINIFKVAGGNNEKCFEELSSALSEAEKIYKEKK